MIRTLQDRAVAAGIDVFMECTITHLLTDGDRVTRRVRLLARRPASRSSSRPRRSCSPPAASARRTRSPRTRGSTRGDGQALAYEAGAELIDMEFVQFHPTGMVWPPGVRGLLVTEAVRGEGGILRNKAGRAVHVEVPARGPPRTSTPRPTRRPPSWVDGALAGPRDRRAPAARALDPRQRRAGDLHRGQGGPRLAARRRLPRHQLPAGRPRAAQAAVDVRAVQGARRRRHHDRADGGRADDATTSWAASGSTPRPGATTVPGPVRRGRGRRRDARREPARRQLALGPARLRGRGPGPARRPTRRPQAGDAARRPGARSRPRRRELEAPFGPRPTATTRTPSSASSRTTMQRLVGIFRTTADLGEALDRARRAARAAATASAVSGGRAYNPGWNLVFELRNLLIVSEADRPQRPAADGEPRRAQPARLPGDRRRRGATATASSRRDADGAMTVDDRAAAGDARRAPRPPRHALTTGDALMPDAHLRVFRGSPGEPGHFDEFDVPGGGGDGRPRRPPLDPGPRGARPRRPLELQGRQVRLVQRRGQRPAEPDLQDAAVRLRPRASRSPSSRCGPSRSSATSSPTSRGTTRSTRRSRRSRRPPTCPRRTGAGSRRTSSGSRNSASASSASCARTSATSCATTRPSSRSSARASSSARPGSRCTRSTTADRRPYLKDEGGIGFCNITKCCTEVCPEHIKITDNAIIPLKERVADEYYDPLQMVWRFLRGGSVGPPPARSCRCCRTTVAGRPRRARRRRPRSATSPRASRRRLTDADRPRPPDARRPTTRRPADPLDGRRDVERRRAERSWRRADRRAGRLAPAPHPHRRRRPRQPRSGLAGAALYRPRAARRPRPAAVPGRVDLGLPRRPDEQRRRVHRRRPRARARPRARGARGPPAPRLEADRRAARRPLAGQGREADPALGGGAPDARAASTAGPRPTCRGPRTRSPTRSRTRRSTGPRRAARRRSCGGPDRDVAVAEPGHGDRRQATVSTDRHPRARRPARRRVWRVERFGESVGRDATRHARRHELGRRSRSSAGRRCRRARRSSGSRPTARRAPAGATSSVAATRTTRPPGRSRSAT